MEKLIKLTEKDVKIYMQSGALTKPFLSDEIVKNKVLYDKITYPQANDIESLMRWIHAHVKSSNDRELANNLKFQRTAKEIWESGISTGCTDWATLFVTFARQLGISSTLLHTAEKSFVKDVQTGKIINVCKGHSFCECYFMGKWILVDPTFKRIEYEYDCNNIHLNYLVGKSYDYISYYRGLDLGKKQTIKDHNDEMIYLVKELSL